jgi:5S rRNA maturation endonuclease (ribonuclease M5)
LPRETALEVYTDKKVLEYANFVLNKDKKNDTDIPEDDERYKKLNINKFWPYYNAAGDIDLMVVRFDYEDRIKKKQTKDVLTYYYDGKNLKMKGYPVLLYNRDKLAELPGLPFLFHEGEKCCDLAGQDLVDFCHITWNGGGKKFDNVQGLEALKGRKIFILGDDDKPGQETAIKLQSRLKQEFGFDSFLVPPFPKAREIKKKGADIEEILQVYTPAEITEIILRSEHGTDTSGTGENRSSHEKLESEKTKGREQSKNDHNNNSSSGLPGGDNNYPFQILGIADDKRAYFIDYSGRLVDYRTTEINGNVLSDLGTLNWFKINEFHNAEPSQKDWAQQIDDIRILSKNVDFDMDSVRGRGAWRDKKGNICYHDGKKTTGTYDKSWTFVRRPKRDIGIESDETDLGSRKEIMDICKTFSFATSADAVRLLSWATLAPFGGALKWRPCVLVTGESGTGKSTILDHVVRPISAATAASGTSTTEAGIRQYCGLDSNGISIDEAEKKSKKDKERMEGIFSLMRGSTTDDAPKSLKGSISGVASSFSMKSMFCFAAIDPTVDDTANDNRIIRINFKRVDNFATFTDNLKRINTLLSSDNCRGIRAYTWNNLQRIISAGEKLELIIQKVTGQDARFAAGESILLSCYMNVWEGLDGDSEEFLTEFVREFYRGQEQEERRDETNELIQRLLDETVLAGEPKESFSFRELLVGIKKYYDKEHADTTGDFRCIDPNQEIISPTKLEHYRKIVEQNGLAVHRKTRELFIVQNHHAVMRIIEMGKGYHRQLERHKKVVERKASAIVDRSTKRGVIIGGMLEYNQE